MDGLGTVNGSTIPDDQQLSGEVFDKIVQEGDDLL